MFAEDAFNLTDKLLLVGGLRYEDVKLDRTTHDFNLATTVGFTRKYKPVSYRAGAIYDLVPKTQLYAQYTKGAAPVGTLVLLSQSNSGFNLTKGDSTEIGVKSVLWGGRVEMTLAGYKIRQTDIITRDPVNPNIQIQGGTLSSKGVEFSATLQATDHLRLDGNAAFVDAQYDELIEAGGANRAGNSPPNVPAQVFNLFASYQVPGFPVRVTGGVHRSSHIFGDNANTVRASGYTLFDASITYQLKFGDITLRGRNLTNKLYAEWATASQVYLGAPRGVDLTFRARF
ncbi:TonB-dependent siderophore receptor [Caulobacter sp. FWC26]|uniref:TonB-dependent receptor n=1 Tax=Caulobacter sp. FWC26 TaxID=69665 RepID=UPI001FEF5CD7|nr:TonB-dependent receptor [Caulobacter sp. FWC26]